MGGASEQFGHPQSQDLVYRTTGDRPTSPKATASDDYTQSYFDRQSVQRKKQMDDLMQALGRLGMVDEAMPRGFVPNPPYRLPEQEFGF